MWMVLPVASMIPCRNSLAFELPSERCINTMLFTPDKSFASNVPLQVSYSMWDFMVRALNALGNLPDSTLASKMSCLKLHSIKILFNPANV
ncbi:hypothetical protein IMSAGC014_01526 [Bacteroidaceae bacterium]|nr:hypothetical protein IMSAGC014_01526 [Bacteroidaceae bacterium]